MTDEAYMFVGHKTVRVNNRLVSGKVQTCKYFFLIFVVHALQEEWGIEPDARFAQHEI